MLLAKFNYQTEVSAFPSLWTSRADGISAWVFKFPSCCSYTVHLLLWSATCQDPIMVVDWCLSFYILIFPHGWSRVVCMNLLRSQDAPLSAVVPFLCLSAVELMQLIHSGYADLCPDKSLGISPVLLALPGRSVTSISTKGNIVNRSEWSSYEGLRIAKGK